LRAKGGGWLAIVNEHRQEIWQQHAALVTSIGREKSGDEARVKRFGESGPDHLGMDNLPRKSRKSAVSDPLSPRI